MGLTALDGRRIQQELLDTASDSEAEGNLRDLLRIHRYLGGERIFLALISRWYRRTDRFHLLDIGSGACPLQLSLARRYPRANIVSTDKSIRNLHHGAGCRLGADALRLPFAERSFDVVCCNLVLHHFPDHEVVEVLREMRRVSRQSVICIDLERHWAARRFLTASHWFFQWSPVTLHDGPVSVDAGFHREELQRLAGHADCRGAQVLSHAPWFRLSLTWRREAS
ncbi:MAG: methyltransferase domain-containing protein [Acidobacteria bacterium]|nr:methyltransferase domain-containing protein [Acidobacteriota bacterium]